MDPRFEFVVDLDEDDLVVNSLGPETDEVTFVRPCETMDVPSKELGEDFKILKSICLSSYGLLLSCLSPADDKISILDMLKMMIQWIV